MRFRFYVVGFFSFAPSTFVGQVQIFQMHFLKRMPLSSLSVAQPKYLCRVCLISLMLVADAIVRVAGSDDGPVRADLSHQQTSSVRAQQVLAGDCRLRDFCRCS